MPAPSAVDQQRAFTALSTLSRRDLAAIWPKLNLNSPAKLAEPLSEVVSMIVAKYGVAAATLAANWFDESRIDAGVSGRFTAITASLPDTSKVDALSRWGVGPLFGASGDAALALSLVSGGMQRMVAGMGRDTTALSVANDPGSPTYARHASANACAFCAMLAQRGAVYSDASAARVTGESLGGKDYRYLRQGRAPYTGRKSRSSLKRRIGEKYHDDCHCIAVAIWPNQDYEPPAYVSKWEEAYGDARETGESTKDTLSKMREALGTN